MDIDKLLAVLDWFLNSNLFIAAVTLLAGYFTYGVYKKQRSDEKRNAALVLLGEVRNAEKAIVNMKNTEHLSETHFVLPVSSWASLQHHFVNDLDNDELALITDFYNLASLIQSELDKWKSELDLSQTEKIKLTQAKLLELADRCGGKTPEYEKQKKQILDDCFFPEKQWYSAHAPKHRVSKYIGNIRFITTSSCGEKLKRFAGL